VETDPERLLPYTTDRSGHRSAGTPIPVVHPRIVEEVQAVCRTATATGTPVVTRGAGTGPAGSAIAGPEEIVLCLGGMDQVLEVPEDNRLAVVQSGVLNVRIPRTTGGGEPVRRYGRRRLGSAPG